MTALNFFSKNSDDRAQLFSKNSDDRAQLFFEKLRQPRSTFFWKKILHDRAQLFSKNSDDRAQLFFGKKKFGPFFRKIFWPSFFVKKSKRPRSTFFLKTYFIDILYQ